MNIISVHVWARFTSVTKERVHAFMYNTTCVCVEAGMGEDGPVVGGSGSYYMGGGGGAG